MMMKRQLAFVLALTACAWFWSVDIGAQTSLKKVRMALPTHSATFLAAYSAYHKGFYKDEGIDLEIIIMQPTLASTALLTGDLDYNGAVTGVIGAAVRNRPVRAVIFTASKPMQSLFSRKEITDPRQLKGKTIAGSSPGGTVTMLARLVLKHYGFDPDRDVTLNSMGGTGASRLAALESGVVDASILELPENLVAMESGFRELVFFGDLVEFPQAGFGCAEKKIRENPDEVMRMVRATLRGLRFIWDDSHREEIVTLIMKEWGIRNRKTANDMLAQLLRVMTKDAAVKDESIQVLIDLARQNAKVAKPVSVAEVYDRSFVDKARKELGMGK
jgi:NitT/TauT family transport system substrate-binding protein